MKKVRVDEIFDVKYGTNLELVNLQRCKNDDPSSINFVSRTEKKHGISARVQRIPEIKPNPARSISVAGGGSVLSTFFHQEEYYSGRDLYILIPRKEYTDEEMLFFTFVIRKNKYRYNYGRQANKTLKSIMIPEGIPESWTKILYEKIEAPKDTPLVARTPKLDVNNWGWFKLGEIFTIKKGKRLTKENMTPGETPFVGSSEFLNGVTGYIDNPPIHEENTISVTYNGSVAEAFYQPKAFWASDDVNVLYPKFELNAFSALFITSVIRSEKYRFNYGRKWHLDRMNDTRIKLPMAKNGLPDFTLMENYIKSLPYSSSISK